MNLHRLIVIAAIGCVVAACGRDKATSSASDDEATAAGAARPAYQQRDVSDLQSPEYMQYIPADSPFVVASYEPFPKAFLDEMVGSFDGFAQLLQAEIDEALADSSTRPSERAVLGAFDGKLTLDGLESIGVTIDTRFAFYMVEASLVGRVELSDGAKLQAFIEDVASKAGEALPRGDVGGQAFYRYVEDEMLIAVAIQGNELIVAMLPIAAEAEILPVVFKQKKPAKSIVDSGALRDVVAKFGLAGYTPGYIDLRALARGLAGNSSPLARQLGISTSPECEREWMELAEAAPRVVFGYTEVDANKAEGLAVAELRKDLAAELKGLAYPVPGLRSLANSGPMMTFGAGIDMGKALTWLERKFRKIAEQPYQCEQLTWLNELSVEGSTGLREAPPMLKGFKGGVVVIDQYAMNGATPTVAGYGFIGVDQPMELLKMGQALDPSLAKLEVKADGKAVQVPVPIPGLGDAHVAINGKWLGLSLGAAKQSAAMTKAIAAPVVNGGPFMVIAYDYGRFLTSFGDLMTRGSTDMPEELVQNLAEHFGLLLEEFYFEDEGIVMRYEFNLR